MDPKNQNNLYFNANEKSKLSYPCILYYRVAPKVKKANNIRYKVENQYRVTVIDRDPDSVIPDRIVETFEYAYITTNYTSEGLNHTIIEIKY